MIIPGRVFEPLPKRRMAVAAAAEQVVMNRDVAGQIAERREHRVLALGVQAVIQGLGIDRPLQREIAAAPQVVVAVDAPGRRDVVEDHVVDVVGRDGVGIAVRLVLV